MCIPNDYNYSQYCYHFKEYLRHKEVVMHLEHTAAETIMVDFAGKKLSYVDPDTAEVIEFHVFVAVLPHSGLTFCKAVHSQKYSSITRKAEEGKVLQIYWKILKVICKRMVIMYTMFLINKNTLP
jgi:transposase